MLEDLRFYLRVLTSYQVTVLLWYKLPNRKAKLFYFLKWIKLYFDLFCWDPFGQNGLVFFNLCTLQSLYNLIIFSIYIILLKC
jgi:hypothetical protein